MYQIINNATSIPQSPVLTVAEMRKECQVRLSTAGMNQPTYYVKNVETGEAEGNLNFWMLVNG